MKDVSASVVVASVERTSPSISESCLDDYDRRSLMRWADDGGPEPALPSAARPYPLQLLLFGLDSIVNHLSISDPELVPSYSWNELHQPNGWNAIQEGGG